MAQPSQSAYDSQDDSGDELFGNDLQNPAPTQHLPQRSQYVTQPTQPANTPYDRRSSTPQGDRFSPSVQVPASSPIPPPKQHTPSLPPMSRGSLNGGLMAPPGTQFRPPAWQQPQQQLSQRAQDARSQTLDFSQEDIIDSDSDDDRHRQSASLKPTTFNRGVPSPRIEESPQAKVQDFARFAYSPSNISKRPVDDMASAYSSSRRPAKIPRQTGPAKAKPPEDDMTFDDITDYDVRRKVREMKEILPTKSVRQCVDALMKKKGRIDDAMELIALQEEEEQMKQQTRQQKSIDLTASDNEEKHMSHQFKKPSVRREVQTHRTIDQKWSSTQGQRPLQKKPSLSETAYQSQKPSMPDTPDPLHSSPPKQPIRRRLVQGREPKARSPVMAQSLPQARPTTARKPAKIAISDDEDEAIESDADSDEDDEPVDQVAMNELDIKVLDFVNTCTVEDLRAQANQSVENANLVIARRPFSTISEIYEIISESKTTTKSGKAKTTKRHVGEKLVETLQESIEAYEAVDRLVKRCEELGKPVAERMKQWGINVYGSTEGDELSMTDLDASHDSGIGTPTSSVSGEDDLITKPKKRKVLGQPSNMSDNIKMKDYQIAGLNWLSLLYSEGLSCILADDMGLGKTCQVIAFLAHLLQLGIQGPHLIIVPGSTIENWLMEFQRFCPELVVEPYHGAQQDRGEKQLNILQLIEDNAVNVIVTTYDMAFKPADNKFMRRCNPVTCVFDEGHALKNCRSQRYQQLSRINARFRLLLTGTPLQNNLEELLSLLSFIMPDVFASQQENFKTIFTKHKAKTYDTDHTSFLAAERISRARSMMKPFILRRKKQQVLKHLPRKSHRVEYCYMTDRQQNIYNEQAAKLRRTMLTNGKEDAKARKKTSIDLSKTKANVLMLLRQAAIHPLLFRNLFDSATLYRMATTFVEFNQQSTHDLVVEDLEIMNDFELHRFCNTSEGMSQFALDEADMESWLLSGASGKVSALLRILDSFGPDDRVLVFSQFTMVLDILDSVFSARGVVFARLDGSTRIADRQELINEFSEDPTIKVFLLSTKAGGQGINLAAANKVVIFDAGFNPQEEVQAENRAHRVGQEREVEVIRLVTKGSVEELILRLGESKLLLDERVASDESPEDSTAEGEDKAKRGMEIVEQMIKDALVKDTKPQDSTDAVTAVADVSDVDESRVKTEDSTAHLAVEQASTPSRRSQRAANAVKSEEKEIKEKPISSQPSTPSKRPQRAAAAAAKSPMADEGLPVRGRRQPSRTTSRTSSQSVDKQRNDDDSKFVRSGLAKYGFTVAN